MGFLTIVKDNEAVDQRIHKNANIIHHNDNSISSDRKEAIVIVIASWKRIQDITNYDEVAGELLFRKFLSLSPTSAYLYPFTKDGKVYDKTFRQRSFQNHARIVIRAIDDTIRLLQIQDVETLITALRDLGAKHAMWGVNFSHFPFLQEAFLDTLERALGSTHFTQHVKVAWSQIFAFIVQHMKNGMEDFL